MATVVYRVEVSARALHELRPEMNRDPVHVLILREGNR